MATSILSEELKRSSELPEMYRLKGKPSVLRGATWFPMKMSGVQNYDDVKKKKPKEDAVKELCGSPARQFCKPVQLLQKIPKQWDAKTVLQICSTD
jgi:hypothetical protein